MSIEEQIFEVANEITNLQNQIDNLQELDYEIIHRYTKLIFDQKLKLQRLENKAYLERQPDIESDKIDLYLKNIHDLKETSPDKYSYIITLHGTKTKIGVIDIRFSLLKNEKYLGNIGANIDEEYRGKRYSKIAFILLRDVMLEHNLRKPLFTVKETNISSLKSLDNIGAKQVEYVIDSEEPYYIYEYDLEKNITKGK